jgi:hypothetical protein
MNLNDVCQWLTDRDYSDVADIIKDKFSYHIWTVDGMTRKDIIKEIFDRVFDDDMAFRQLECDVTTALTIVPAYEAHVD